MPCRSLPLLPWLHFLVGCLAMALAAAGAEYPRLCRSLMWAPYSYDAGTVALFHLDRANPPDTPLTDDVLDLDAPSQPANGLASATPGGDSAVNAVPTASPAILRGGAAFVPDGRLDGALRLTAPDAALVYDRFSANGSARTAEFWLRLNRLPDPEAALLHVAAPPARDPQRHQADAFNRARGSATWLVLADGSLAIEWFGQRLPMPGASLTPGAWCHLAMAITDDWPWGHSIRAFVNGRPLPPLTVERAQAAMLARESQTVWIGNDPGRQRGLDALIDEVRLSRAMREFYRYDLDWPAPATAPLPAGQPFFRDSDDLLFKLDFEFSLKPAVAAPGTSLPDHPVTEFHPELDARHFPPGVHGRGLLLGEGSLRPVYTAPGNLLPPHGTIACWLQPLDWDNYTRDNRFDQTQPTVFGLFQVIATVVDGSFVRQFHPTYPVLQANLDLHLPEAVDAPWNLAPGQWFHLAMTWQGATFAYFLNGQPLDPEGAFRADLELRTPDDPYPYQKLNPRWWTECGPLQIAFRERRYWEQTGTPVPRSVIDDFRIYRRPLSHAEIANLAALPDPRTAPVPLPPAEMNVHHNGVSGRHRVSLVPLLDRYAEVTAAEVAIHRQGDPDPAGTATMDLDALRQGQVTVVTPPLDFATWEVTATLRDAGGRELGAVRRQFTREPPPWWQSTAGLSDRVMPEWPPVQTAGDTISVVGREIAFDGSGLPARIVAAGQDLLAGPVVVDLRDADGQPVPLVPGQAVTRAVSEVRAEADGGLTGAGLSLRTASYTEFDGMIWFTLTLEADSPRPLGSLTLRLPWRPAAAELVHWWSGARNFREPRHVYIGSLPPGEGVVFRSNDDATLARPATLRGSFIPYVMLTGMERGMAWFAENDRGWTPSLEQPAVSIERHPDRIELVLRPISTPIVLDRPRVIEFGLQPIPVRPLDPNWRMYPGFSTCFPDSFSGNNLKGRKGPTAFNTLPEDDWDGVHRRLAGEGLTRGAPSLRSKSEAFPASFEAAWGRPPLPAETVVPGLYWDLQNTGIHPAHTREWAETWGAGHGDVQYYDRAFNDYCAWAWEQWIARTGKFVRGVYMDDCWGAPQLLPGGPVAYVLPDGHVQPGYQFRGYRERILRLRRICHDLGIQPRLTAHSTHTLFIPWHSGFDLILDGEDFYASPPQQETFLERWPLDRLRFMHNAKWGLVTTWLPWHGNSLPIEKWPAWTYRQQRSYRAGMALHDIMWPFPGDLAKRFGLREPDCVQIPYWNDGGLAAGAPPGLVVGAWKRPGRCLVMVVNHSPDPLAASLSLDTAVMGLGTDPEKVAIEDVDPDLLVYFSEDTTRMATPTAADTAAPAPDPEVSLDEAPETLPLDQRRARDPDGKFAWAAGRLSCPVRPRDYRLFLFAAP